MPGSVVEAFSGLSQDALTVVKLFVSSPEHAHVINEIFARITHDPLFVEVPFAWFAENTLTIKKFLFQ